MTAEKGIAERIEELQKSKQVGDVLSGKQKDAIEQAQSWLETGVVKKEDYKIVAPTTIRGQEASAARTK
jgi:hypothetical protein